MSSFTFNSNFRRPCIWTLPMSRRTLLLSDLPSTEIARNEAFHLFTDAARRADNVGTDEIPSLKYFDWLLNFADDVIVLYEDVTSGENDSSGPMAGLLVIFPCRYVRSCHPSNASLWIVTGESISSRLVWRDLARLGFEIATGSEFHYTGCTIDVFVTCIELVAALREEGFVITACIPDAGLVSGFPGRHIDSYVMYKELSTPPGPLQLTSSEESPEEHEDDIPDDVNLRTVPFLPVRYVLADGTAIIVRSMSNREEMRSFYDAFKSTAATGEGYGLDELPSIGYFVQWYVDDFYNLVFELDTSSPQTRQSESNTSDSGHAFDSSGTVICYSNFGPSLFSRSITNSVLSDGNIVMLPEFRGRRWSGELGEIHRGISYDVGNRKTCGETSMKNIPTLMLWKRFGGTVAGSIPRGIYYKDVGWMDLVISSALLSESFEEMQRKNTHRQKASKM